MEWNGGNEIVQREKTGRFLNKVSYGGLGGGRREMVGDRLGGGGGEKSVGVDGDAPRAVLRLIDS